MGNSCLLDEKNLDKSCSEDPRSGVTKTCEEKIGAAGRFFESLGKISRYEKTPIPDSSGQNLTAKSNPEEKYSIQLVDDPESPIIDKIAETLQATFKGGEVHDADVFRNYVRRNIENPDDRGRYIIVAILDEKGDVKAFLAGMYATDKKRKEGTMMIGYVLVHPDSKRMGFMTELYERFFEEGDNIASGRNETVRYVAGEAVEAVESRLNGLGRARIYLKDGESSFQELQYFQPPLDWDQKSGTAKDPNFYPEHIMVADTTGAKCISSEAVERILDDLSYYLHGYVTDRNFPNYLARANARETVLQSSRPIRSQIDEADNLELISASEREVYKGLGFQFKEVDTGTPRHAVRGKFDSEFEHKVAKNHNGAEIQTGFTIKVLTEDLLQPLLDNLRDSWTEAEYAYFAKTLNNYLSIYKADSNPLINKEYYVAIDPNGKPFAVTGLYTIDIQGGAGFGTENKLDSEHHLATGLGWFAINKEYQGLGIGEYLLDWTEEMAKTLGASYMFIESDDTGNTIGARKLYEKKGYKFGFQAPDFFGEGRDLHSYHMETRADTAENPELLQNVEKISEQNKEEILALASKYYSAKKFQEFKIIMDELILKHGDKSSYGLYTIVNRDMDGKIESFSVIFQYIYTNISYNVWDCYDPNVSGSQERMIENAVAHTGSMGVRNLLFYRDSEDIYLEQHAKKPGPEGIAFAFSSDGPAALMFYTKKLR